MLQAFEKISGLRDAVGQRVLATVESVEGILDSNGADDGFDASISSLHKVSVYKDLLVESQFEHVKAYRECEKVIAEKEDKIRELLKACGKESEKENDPCTGNPDKTSEKSKNKRSLSVDCKPLSEDNENHQAIYVEYDEWEKRMKANIEEKLEAIAEARIQQETTNALQRQMVMLKEHIRFQDTKLEKLNNIKELLTKKQDGNEHALEDMAMEYSKLSSELEGYSQREAAAIQEKELLLQKIESQQKSIEMLTSSADTCTASISPASKNSMKYQKLIEKLEQSHAEQIKNISAEISAQYEKQIEELKKSNSESKASSEEIAHLNEELERFKSINESNVIKLNELENSLKKKETEVTQLRETTIEAEKKSKIVSELENTLKDKEAENTKLRETIVKDEKKTEQVEKTITELKEKMNETELENEKTIQELEHSKTTLEKQLFEKAENEEENLKLLQAKTAENEKLSSENKDLESVCQDHLNNLENMRKECRENELKMRESEESREKQDQVIGKLNQESEEKEKEIESLKEAMEESKIDRDRQVKSLQETIEEGKNEILNLEKMKEDAELERDEALSALGEAEEQRKKMVQVQKLATENLEKQCSKFQSLYAKESKLRKTVHNELCNLRGNIRVFCRVRPMLDMESDSTPCTEYPAENELTVRSDEVTGKSFEFDSVYDKSSTQEKIFEDISPLVTSTLDGYNVCIFAYGQTGSGKTYTMEGPKENPGVNKRTLERFFSIRDEKKDDIEVSINVSILEIYNEAVFDLVNRSQNSLDIRVNEKGSVYVQGLQEVECESMEDVTKAINTANKNRTVGGHKMNEHSSRSHLVLTVNAKTKNKVTGKTTMGKLSLIDLAGSERVSKTDASGERLKEAQNINRSLSALGDVIGALQEKKKHVPFRNSKLTFLLQNSLNGDSKVAMFVNISPVLSNAPESVCSLNFASRCRKVQLGQAKKNSDSAEILKYRKVIDDLQAQIASIQRVNGYKSTAATPKKQRGRSVSRNTRCE